MGVGEISAMIGLIRRNCLNFEMKDDLAQLFFEAKYADEQEEGRHIGNITLRLPVNLHLSVCIKGEFENIKHM